MKLRTRQDLDQEVITTPRIIRDEVLIHTLAGTVTGIVLGILSVTSHTILAWFGLE